MSLQMSIYLLFACFFFFNDTATTEIYTLSLHDALPICWRKPCRGLAPRPRWCNRQDRDRKSTRLNSSHTVISYAVFCLKKKKKQTTVGESGGKNHVTGSVGIVGGGP